MTLQLKLILIFFLIFPFHLKGEGFIFEDSLGNTNKDWEFISDNIMGGVSSGKLRFISEGDYTFARLTGKVSLENNGGFIQFRKKVRDINNDFINGIRINARGNKKKYFVHIRTTGTILPWQYYQAQFTVDEKWQIIKILYSAFERSGIMLSKVIDPNNITSIAIVAYGYEHIVKVDVKSISFY